MKTDFKYYGPKGSTSTFGTNGDKDYRGRLITFKDGKRRFHRPTKKIENCFEIETISWSFTGTDKAGKQTSVFVRMKNFFKREFPPAKRKNYSDQEIIFQIEYITYYKNQSLTDGKKTNKKLGTTKRL
ncbi:MAG: hypothetical protein ABI067_08330 [Leifsonia sp.]